MAAGDFRKVIPVAFVAIERDVAVGEIEIERAIVVEIAELRAETPSADFHAEIARQVVILNSVARRAFFRNPQIVPLDQHTFF